MRRKRHDTRLASPKPFYIHKFKYGIYNTIYYNTHYMSVFRCLCPYVTVVNVPNI